jgi:hypothetical protein
VDGPSGLRRVGDWTIPAGTKLVTYLMKQGEFATHDP